MKVFGHKLRSVSIVIITMQSGIDLTFMQTDNFLSFVEDDVSLKDDDNLKELFVVASK